MKLKKKLKFLSQKFIYIKIIIMDLDLMINQIMKMSLKKTLKMSSN